MIGKRVIVRDNRAGVHFGTLVSFDGPSKCARLTDARKVWYWQGAASCHGLAARGLRHDGSKVCPVVATVDLLDVVEVVECSEEGAASRWGAPEWRP